MTHDTYINSIEDVRSFVAVMYSTGIDFHPETPVKAYVSIREGKKIFTREQADHLQSQVDRCKEVCNERLTVYQPITLDDIAVSVLRELTKEKLAMVYRNQYIPESLVYKASIDPVFLSEKIVDQEIINQYFN